MNKKYLKSGRTNQKLETRKKIISSAQYFINSGISFTLEDVAKHAEISRATVYRYYSKVEILSSEAGIAFQTDNSETIYEKLKHLDLDEKLFGIQEYYNNLAIDKEKAFRKYLSIVITTPEGNDKRGARRNETLQLALKSTKLSPQEKTKLTNLLTVLMGIEPLIVSKDVCGLTNNESKELLKWGMEIILKSLAIDEG
jgi:AcrR family transcriptional regulator